MPFRRQLLRRIRRLFRGKYLIWLMPIDPPRKRLDIYWPGEGNGPFPVIISIHGGAFMGGDKRDIQLTADAGRRETRLRRRIDQLPHERRGAYSRRWCMM